MVGLWDSGGLVFKRFEITSSLSAPALRLISANPAYEQYTCLINEAHIMDKVLRTIRRVWGVLINSAKHFSARGKGWQVLECVAANRMEPRVNRPTNATESDQTRISSKRLRILREPFQHFSPVHPSRARRFRCDVACQLTDKCL